MRNGAPLLVALLFGVLTSPGLSAEELTLVGKPADWESLVEKPKTFVHNPADGDALETPNHRRRRLGLPIEASFPPPDYGVREETPNQIRHRLGLPEDAPLPTFVAVTR